VFACICRAVTDDEVRAAVDRGATTVKAVANETRAGTGCGTCQDWIKSLIDERGEPCPARKLRVA
jgi:bacterioferritin-associated ferredoxin